VSTRPEFLTGPHARAWDDPEVAALYRHRLLYPPALFDALIELLGTARRVVLDAGAGTGAIARNIASRVERVDAVEPSAAMIAEARRLPGGDSARIRWIRSTAEDAPLDGPYGMIVTSQSLHWMDWQVVIPRFAAALAPDGHFAIVDDPEEPEAWSEGLLDIIRRYSMVQQAVHQFALIPELERRGLFVREGERRIDPLPMTQTVNEYIASFHARSSLARNRIGPEAAAKFDAEVRALVAGRDSIVRHVGGRIVWGRPVAP